MPKSKRAKVVPLTRTVKQGFQAKEALISEIRDAADAFSTIFVFSVKDMRNARLKDVRNKWKTSRFFLGKNKVMAIALGQSEAEEHRPGLHKVAELVTGNIGLMFTNEDRDEVKEWFKSFSEPEYARAGNVATDTVVLEEGPMKQFSHSIEPHLRALGMPTTLNKGIVTCSKKFTVCKKGDVLTPERASILKLLENRMANFKVVITHEWTADNGCVAVE
eukprot:m.73534 g.73534  ORF g.73534 m.73534 type:complete len:219 (+) comp16124_c0_seq14:267-923(+)